MEGKAFKPKIIPKSAEAMARIVASTEKSFLFSGLNINQKKTIYDAMEELKVKEGEEIITQYDNGDYFYVVERGKFDVLKKMTNKGEPGEFKKVFFYDNSGSFGELALMYNCPRAATVKATSDAVLWRVDRETFRHIIIVSAAKQRALHEKFLETVPILSKLEKTSIGQIADCLRVGDYNDGDVILTQGEETDEFYIVEEGEVQITQTPAGKDGSEPVEVNKCKRGDYFGERRLLLDEPRAANAVAVGKCKCVILDKATFERLLGDMREEMNTQIENYINAE